MHPQRRQLALGGLTSVDGYARERGLYWYFWFHESGKRKKHYLDKTNDLESTLAAERAELSED